MMSVLVTIALIVVIARLWSRLDRLQEACAFAFKKGQWNAVAIEYAVAGKRCKLWPRREDAGEV